MKSKTAEQALSKSLAFLSVMPEKEVSRLSLSDSVFMLNALPGTPSMSATRRLLAERLHAKVSALWIEQGNAYEVYSVLAALWQYSPIQVRSDWLAAAVRRLVLSEAAEGGPYYDGNTVAIAANVQIANFVGLVAHPLPNMDNFLAEIVTAERFEETELTRFALLYLLSASCNRPPELERYVTAHWQSDSWQTPWRRAVVLNVFQDKPRTAEMEGALLALCRQQEADGCWHGEALTRGAQQGSRFVTTAIIAGILSKYLYSPPGNLSSSLQHKQRTVAQAAARLFDRHSEPLRSSALAAIDRVCAADENFEITLMPKFFAHALGVSHLTSSFCTTLGLANLCTWIAYTIYDDFLDGEGVPADLPVANLAMRASLNCFRKALPADIRFQRYAARVFNGMDEANAWEMNHCRFAIHKKRVTIAELPEYGNCMVLASRALAHALTPLAILAQCSPDYIKKSRHIELAFRHYLIARQLNDDMHDWCKDVQAGQATYVVTAILRDMLVKHDAYSLDALLPAMQSCFRHTTMPKICQRMQRHITASRRHFGESRLLRPPNGIYQLLDNLELSVRNSMDKRAKGQAMMSIGSLNDSQP